MNAVPYGSKWLPVFKVDTGKNATNRHRYCPVLPQRGIKERSAIIPGKEFQNIVAVYQELHYQKKSGDDMPEAFPLGCLAIVFGCRRNNPEGYLLGNFTAPVELDYAKSDTTYFCIYLWPGQHFPVFPFPADELTNRYVKLEDIIPHCYKNLLEGISGAESLNDRINIWEQFLTRQTKRFGDTPNYISKIVDAVGYSQSMMSNKQISNICGYTDRHIRRIFLKYVGVSPNMFLRIMRYQKTLISFHHNPPTNFVDLAYAIGYYDQAHFNNEFKTFHGSTPKKFVKEFFPGETVM